MWRNLLVTQRFPAVLARIAGIDASLTEASERECLSPLEAPQIQAGIHMAISRA